MTPHLIFNNLTLVSPIFHDDKFIAVGKKRETVETRLVNHFGAAKTGLNVSVNRVRGTMAGIHPAKAELKNSVLSKDVKKWWQNQNIDFLN